MVDFNSREPEEVIESAWVAEYRAKRLLLVGQLRRISDRVQLSRRLLDFPWELFFESPPHSIRLIMESLFESIVMAAWRLSIDTGSDGLTLHQFKNLVLEHLKDDALKTEFRRRLKAQSFDDRVAEVETAIERLRMSYFAHLDRELQLAIAAGTRKPTSLPFPMLIDYTLALKNFFDVLDFQPGATPLFSAPYYEHGADDMESILDAVVLQAPLLRLPESSPLAWETKRSTMTAEQVAFFNEFRTKFKLPRVQWKDDV